MEGRDAPAKYSAGVGVGETWCVDEVEWESTNEADNRPAKDKEKGYPECALGKFAIRWERRLGSEGRNKGNRGKEEGPKR